MTVRSPATPQRAPTSAAAAACCQRSSSGTRNVMMWGSSRTARQRSNRASRNRSTRASAGSTTSGSALWLTACSRPGSPIVIGLAGPFSDPGGTSMLRGAQLAVAQINAQGGVRGRPLKLRIVDDSGSEDQAVRVAEQLYADPALVAVVGHLSSDASRAAAEVYGRGPSPLVT